MMWWKRLTFAVVIVLLACAAFGSASAEANVRWRTYVNADGVSFEYPDGWVVEEIESGFMVYDEETYEQLWLVVLPYEQGWNAQDHGEWFMALIQEENPEMDAFGWELDETGDYAFFNLQQGAGQYSAHGFGLTIKDNEYEQTLWFHYLVHRNSFDEDRALELMERFVNSLTSGSDDVPLAVVDEVDDEWIKRVNMNVDGFLFVLEFALGSPLSLAEETLIGSQLRDVMMTFSEERMLEFDDFPFYAAFLMVMDDREELMDMQIALEQAVWDWVEQSEPNDPVVELIREALLEADRILVPGRTPLTELAATAYAEFLVFAEHLGSNGEPDLRLISDLKVKEIKERLVEAWRDFSDEERQQVLQLPAIWTTLRRALSLGDGEYRDYAIKVIRSSAPQAADGTSGTDGNYDARKWLNYQTSLAIQQQTFNYYMWSVGYNKTIYGF
jgi:hypothetical protein